MPASLTPPPGENEIECANCGAYVFMELSRCPNCGINLYEPEPEPARHEAFHPRGRLARLVKSIWRGLRGVPDPAQELFGAALQEKALFDNLLLKVGGDRTVVERLIAHERRHNANATRVTCLQGAIRRWERENRP